ncbi:MAG TPA: prepilin-type N-terminal cleavage/methylation domain-containing protein, partial [Gemmatimonadales bacterium]|nr:prepilin-type N-terminal cleavage/methylation domain-containing protein [Gemmatimonadales bacterium]
RRESLPDVRTTISGQQSPPLEDGMMNRKGFTLIELLIVVVIIGILAAIAIPKFAATKQKAYLAAMKSDLRNLATSQESYLADQNPPAYFNYVGDNTAPFMVAGQVLYAPSTGVTVTATAVPGGWSATAVHLQAPGRSCAIFINTVPVAPATIEGEPACN